LKEFYSITIFYYYYRLELADVNYHFGLVEAGEQEVVRTLQESLQRQSNTNTLNKQLFQERSTYLSDTKVNSRKIYLKKKLFIINLDSY
jgi:hypothetical protein